MIFEPGEPRGERENADQANDYSGVDVGQYGCDRHGLDSATVGVMIVEGGGDALGHSVAAGGGDTARAVHNRIPHGHKERFGCDRRWSCR